MILRFGACREGKFSTISLVDRAVYYLKKIIDTTLDELMS
jgi:hypothetical protein